MAAHACVFHEPWRLARQAAAGIEELSTCCRWHCHHSHLSRRTSSSFGGTRRARASSAVEVLTTVLHRHDHALSKISPPAVPIQTLR